MESHEEIDELLQQLTNPDLLIVLNGLDEVSTYIHEAAVRSQILNLLQHEQYGIRASAARIVIQHRDHFGSLLTVPDLDTVLLDSVAVESRLVAKAGALHNVAIARLPSTLAPLTELLEKCLLGQAEGCTGEMIGENDMSADREHATYKHALIYAIEQVGSTLDDTNLDDLLTPTQLIQRCLDDSRTVLTDPDGPESVASAAIRALGRTGHSTALPTLIDCTKAGRPQHLRVRAIRSLRDFLGRLSRYSDMGQATYNQVADALSPLLYDDAIEDRWPDEVILQLEEPWRSAHSLDDTWTYPTLSEVVVETLSWLIEFVPVPALIEWRKWYVQTLQGRHRL